MGELLWFHEVVLPLLGLGFASVVTYGIYRTANRWIDSRKVGRGGEQGASRDELEQLRGRLEELEDAALRVQELEERVDFAERLLTQQREPQQLIEGE